MENKWAGKVWNAVGDSITEWNDTTSKNYHDYIQEKISCTVNNYGISGTGWFTPNTSNGINQIFNRIDSLDPSADLITVFAGTNDVASVGKHFVLGAFGDTDPQKSFYGAIDFTLRQLISKYPTKIIAVFTPLQREVSDPPVGTVTAENMSRTADAIIKVAGKYSIPALDLYRLGNMYPWDDSFRVAMMPDGLHPNELGHKVMADKILAFLNTL